MGLLDNVERGLERLVSGAFAKSFRGGVQPIEIIAALKREMDSHAVVVQRGEQQRAAMHAAGLVGGLQVPGLVVVAELAAGEVEAHLLAVVEEHHRGEAALVHHVELHREGARGEREVLRLLALGHTNQEIARMLYISVRTAETHRAHIMQKLGLGTRAELVRYALVNGLLEGNRLVRDNPDAQLDVIGKAFKWSREQTKAELAKPFAPKPRAAREVMRLNWIHRTMPPPRSTRTRINHAFGVSLDTW